MAAPQAGRRRHDHGAMPCRRRKPSDAGEAAFGLHRQAACLHAWACPPRRPAAPAGTLGAGSPGGRAPVSCASGARHGARSLAGSATPARSQPSSIQRLRAPDACTYFLRLLQRRPSSVGGPRARGAADRSDARPAASGLSRPAAVSFWIHRTDRLASLAALVQGGRVCCSAHSLSGSVQPAVQPAAVSNVPGRRSAAHPAPAGLLNRARAYLPAMS